LIRLNWERHARSGRRETEEGIMDGTTVLARIWRFGPSANLGQRRAYGFLRLAELLRDDPNKLARALSRAYAHVGTVPPETDHATFWIRGKHPIQLAAMNAV
jgi:hypothetical protein